MKKLCSARLFWILLATPYFKPALFGVLEGTDGLETLLDVWRMGAAGIVLMLYLWRLLSQRKWPSPAMLCLGGYLGFVALSTVTQASNYWFLINQTATVLTFCMLLELALGQDPMYCLDMLYYPLTVLILANFILLLLYPDGICTGGTYYYSYNLLGIDNLLSPILVPYMLLTALRATMRTGDLDLGAYFMIFISALTLLLVWSATGLMGLGVALVFLLFFYQRRYETIFNGVTALIPGFGLFYGVVVFRLQEVFSFLIEKVLHKGLSFTGRTDIWDTAIANFLKQPFLGYGLAQSGKVYRLRKGKYYHAHNLILELLMEGGICALLCYLLLLGLSANQLLRHRRHPYACLLSSGLMAVLVMTTMEPFLGSDGLMIYGLLFLSYHVGTLIAGAPTAPVAAS